MILSVGCKVSLGNADRYKRRTLNISTIVTLIEKEFEVNQILLLEYIWYCSIETHSFQATF